jgi:signal transduction histidine kinase/ActR/RegA family two-component response regulator
LPGRAVYCYLGRTDPGRLPLSQRQLLVAACIPAFAGLTALALAAAGWPGGEAGSWLLGAAVLLQALAGLLLAALAARRLGDAAAEREAATARARQAALEEAERDRARLLGTVAHEIRTPLGGIIGLMEAVRTTPALPPRAREDATAALDAARDLTLLLDDLVGISATPGAPAALPFRVDEVMEGVVTLLSARAAAAGTRLATAVSPGTPPAWRGDPSGIRQVLVNLVANALRFTSGGEVRIEARQTAAGALELRVSDTGRGIPPERMGRLFEAFAWSDGGSGLGLSICRDIARRMGGTIGVESAPGRGSAFAVTLPLPEAEESEMPVSLPPVAPLAAPPVAPVPVRSDAARPVVLVVDDVPVNRRLLGALLDRAGYAHEEAADAEAALELAASRDYAAVLMDVEMPGMDGLEATRRLRALPGRASAMPVVAVTADATGATEARARAAGMDEYLVKPVSPDRLRGLLHRLAARAPAQP